MPIPTTLFELPAPEGARRLARHRLDEAVAAAGAVAAGEDPEALHDFRVAVRRLRSVMRSFEALLEDTVSGKRKRQLREVASATNVARDTEVHIAWLRDVRTAVTARERAGVDWLVRRLDARQEGEAAELLKGALKRFARLAATLRAELGSWHQVHYLDDAHEPEGMATATATLLRRAVGELETCLDDIRGQEDEARAHEARIAGKRLRYLLEPVVDVLGEGKPLLQKLKALQDALGDLHDAHVFSREVVGASAEAAAEMARAESAAVLGARPGMRKKAPARDPRAGLLALAERVRDRGISAWTQVHEAWLEDRAKPFLDDVRGLATWLEAHGAGTVEIERKYLLSGLPPEVEGHPSAELFQGYVPGRRLIERVRRVVDADGERWFRTVKGGRGVQRLEVEEETTREVFDALWALTAGRRVHKRRWFVPSGTHTLEIDQFLDRDLWLAEVELATVDEAVVLPDWLQRCVVREVTMETEYGNLALAR